MSHHRNPRALLTPAMRSVLDRIARAGHPPLHALTPDQARAAYEAGAGVLELKAHKLARVLWHLRKFKQPFNPEVFAKEEAKMKRKKLQRLHSMA